ncbi:MAG: hypothetical protein E7256_00915 [Lachnospiraceae bacterium]|nr:hypothetical protein [Lachnospiraceae bacterium]
MSTKPGVSCAKKADGTHYYRSSITFQTKHISLGSFPKEEQAHQAYQIASNILKGYMEADIDSYHAESHVLSFDKWVMLVNLKQHGIYCRNPIFLQNRYFLYYLDEQTPLKFDADDLFYYMNHKIMRRGGHLFVSDYGMQVNILSRYGIKNYAVAGRDYLFANGDPYDFRYGNILIINRYHGVHKTVQNGRDLYITKILIHGEYIVGKYETETEAAIAYNKAAHLLREKGIPKSFPENYIESIDEIAYARIYNNVRISKKIRCFVVQNT